MVVGQDQVDQDHAGPEIPRYEARYNKNYASLCLENRDDNYSYI